MPTKLMNEIVSDDSEQEIQGGVSAFQSHLTKSTY